MEKPFFRPHMGLLPRFDASKKHDLQHKDMLALHEARGFGSSQHPTEHMLNAYHSFHGEETTGIAGSVGCSYQVLGYLICHSC
jgi:hypothetical protein